MNNIPNLKKSWHFFSHLFFFLNCYNITIGYEWIYIRSTWNCIYIYNPKKIALLRRCCFFILVKYYIWNKRHTYHSTKSTRVRDDLPMTADIFDRDVIREKWTGPWICSGLGGVPFCFFFLFFSDIEIQTRCDIWMMFISSCDFYVF